MAGIGIRGLVRAARRATEEMRAGFAEADKPEFTGRLRRDLEWIEDFLAEEGCTEDDLPTPSRRAIEVLRRFAAMAPSELPDRAAGTAPEARLRVTGAVRLLDSFLAHLERGASPEDGLAHRIRSAADAVEASCRAAGGDTSALPIPSRRAFAMLRWLGDECHLERYVTTVASAVRVLPRALADGGLDVPDETRVRIEPGRHLWRASRSAEAYRWTLSLGFLDAEEADLEALALVAALRKRAPESARRRVHALGESEDFSAAIVEVERVAAPASGARGRAHDLDAAFDRLDAAYFRGSLARPRMEWTRSLSLRLFGFYVATHDLVCLNPVLDDPAVPASVVECVLYHELLHKKHGTRLRGGRRHVHPPEFRAEERLHPGFEESERVLRILARGPSDSAAIRDDADSQEPEPLPEQMFATTSPRATLPPASPLGRNAPCPCGSGRKYKRCHLAVDTGATARPCGVSPTKPAA